MRRLAAVVLFIAGVSASAQDVLTVGSAAAPSGGVVQVPMSIRDRSGTALGVDQGSGNRIQAFAFKVLFRSELVSSVEFARAGIVAAPTPLFETTMEGEGWSSAIVSFSESSNPIPFTSDLAAPGNLVGTLTVTLTPQATNGTSIALTIDPPSAVLSNQASTIRETVSAGTLALVNGSITVSDSAAPSSLVATAAGTSQVGLTWTAAAGAAQYEVWRASGGAPLSFLATAPGPSYTDNAVSSGVAYLYRVRALSGGGTPSPFSNIDVATTIVFTDDPVVAQSTSIKSVHVTELRTAVNAVRTAAGLPALAADPTVATGAAIAATHVNAVRTGLIEARSAIGLPSLTLTDPSLSAGLTVKAAHVQELRAGTR